MHNQCQKNQFTYNNLNLTSTECLLSGVVAGVAARTVTAPLELIKTLFQLQETPISSTNEKGFHGVIDALIKLSRQEGFLSLWKGNGVGCLRLGPYSGLKFLLYDKLKLQVYQNELNASKRLFLGSLAGIIATVVTYPLDIVKTRMTVQKRGEVYKGTSDALLKMLRKEGTHSLFKGLTPTLIGVIPFEGVQFAVYETLKEYTVDSRWPSWRWPESKLDSDAMDILVIGSLAGAAGQTVSYPFDLVRKRMQVFKSQGFSVSRK
jgi:solute carrier family 25 phosphate transporter 23/24/25/41